MRFGTNSTGSPRYSRGACAASDKAVRRWGRRRRGPTCSIFAGRWFGACWHTATSANGTAGWTGPVAPSSAPASWPPNRVSAPISTTRARSSSIAAGWAPAPFSSRPATCAARFARTATSRPTRTTARWSRRAPWPPWRGCCAWRAVTTSTGWGAIRPSTCTPSSTPSGSSAANSQGRRGGTSTPPCP